MENNNNAYFSRMAPIRASKLYSETLNYSSRIRQNTISRKPFSRDASAPPQKKHAKGFPIHVSPLSYRPTLKT